MRKPELLNAQYRLDPDSRALVEHTCYADCSQIKEKTIAEIEELLSKQGRHIRGNLYPNEIDDIMRLIRECRNISQRTKDRFGFQ
jgi:hypothetical protein